MRRRLLVPVLALAATSALHAQSTSAGSPHWPIRLTPGVTMVQTLQMPNGDRESLVTIEKLDRSGIGYMWSLLEIQSTGDTLTAAFPITVSAEDLARAGRWHESISKGKHEYAGYTIFSLSTSVYQQLRTKGSAPFAIRSDEARRNALPMASASTRPVVVLWRGTLTRVSANPEAFPLIVNGERVTVPALRVRGQFTAARQRRWHPDMWVLADSVNPLLLKVTRLDNIWQTIRIDNLSDNAAALIGNADLMVGGGDRRPASHERKWRKLSAVLTRECRVEVPGIYFAFNSAALYKTSHTAIGALANILASNPGWIATIEGHTDSIGTAKANQLLSQRRAEAVRNQLINDHKIPGKRLRAVGFGAARPREANSTIEGRARNRRVELVRECTGKE